MAITTIVDNYKLKLYKVSFGYADITAAAKTVDISLLVIPAKAFVVDCWIKVNTNFAGGGESASTLGLGVGTAELLAAASSFTGTPLIVAYGTGKDAEAYVKSTSATTDIRLFATTTTNNLSGLTTGAADAYILVAEAD